MKKYYVLLLIFIPLLISCSDPEPSINNIKIFHDKIAEYNQESFLNDYIFSVENMLVEKDSTSIRLSIDGGETWGNWLDISIVGKIRFIYVFADSKLLICNDTKAFYSQNWETINESTVYDSDGKIFVPIAKYHNFSVYEMDGIRQIIDGKEIISWGSYCMETNPNFIPRVWYTADEGITIKCCFNFQKSIPSNGKTIVRVRHVHCVNFNKEDSTFWLQTGDFNTQNNWLKGTYNNFKDTWTWKLIGSGNHFKTNMLCFHDGYIYASWDISPGGIFRVKYEDAADSTKQELLFSTPNDCLSISVGPRGDILAILAWNPGNKNPRYLYYSPDGKNFHEIKGYLPVEFENNGYQSVYYFTWGLNSNHKILSGIYNYKNALLEWDLSPSIWLDDIVRNAGFSDAFLPISTDLHEI